MSPRSLARRAYERVNRQLLGALGRDSVTLERIARHRPMTRIGTVYGGWSVPEGVLNRDSICYCAGCGEDISFDLGLIERYGCQVFAFDPTPRAVTFVERTAGMNPAYHFLDVGLWSRDETLKFYAPQDPRHVSHSLVNLQHTTQFIEVRVKRLMQLMEANRHRRLDLLKLDIEGAEYAVLDSIAEDELHIRVLCVEFDEYWHPQDSDYLQRIRRYVKALLSRGYEMVSTTGNANYTFMLNDQVRDPTLKLREP
jgi:FkbM family methyltransferase